MGKKKNEKDKTTTMKDVAKLANVALSTVSHIINGTAPISDATKERVLHAINELNYTPNALARGLRQNRTNLIGVVMPDMANEFYAKTSSSILQMAEEYNYVTVLINTRFVYDTEKNGVEALIRRRVDGLIFLGGNKDEDIIDMADQANIPVVLADRHYKDYPSVEFDNITAMGKLIEYLYQKEIRNIGYVSELSNMINIEERYQGFREALNKYNLTVNEDWIIRSPKLKLEKMDTAKEIMENYLKNCSKMPEVFLTSSDMIAVGVINALVEKGFHVPQDIKVAGFDNITISKYNKPSITTMEQNTQMLGSNCFKMLLNEIDKSNEDKHKRLDIKLIIRDSTGSI